MRKSYFIAAFALLAGAVGAQDIVLGTPAVAQDVKVHFAPANAKDCKVLKRVGGMNPVQVNGLIPVMGPGCPSLSSTGVGTMQVTSLTAMGGGWYRLSNGAEFNLGLGKTR